MRRWSSGGREARVVLGVGVSSAVLGDGGGGGGLVPGRRRRREGRRVDIFYSGWGGGSGDGSGGRGAEVRDGWNGRMVGRKEWRWGGAGRRYMYICGQRSTCQAHLDPIMAVAFFPSGGGEVSWWRPGVLACPGVIDEPAVVSLTGRCRVQRERRGRAITQATEMEIFNTRFQAPNDYDWWHSSPASDQIFGWSAKKTSCKAVSW